MRAAEVRVDFEAPSKRRLGRLHGLAGIRGIFGLHVEIAQQVPGDRVVRQRSRQRLFRGVELLTDVARQLLVKIIRGAAAVLVPRQESFSPNRPRFRRNGILLQQLGDFRRLGNRRRARLAHRCGNGTVPSERQKSQPPKTAKHSRRNHGCVILSATGGEKDQNGQLILMRTIGRGQKEGSQYDRRSYRSPAPLRPTWRR